MDWCRNNNVTPTDEPTVPWFEKMPSIPLSKKSPEDREKVVDDIISWLRAGKPNELDTPNDEFAKIDQMLPQKKGQSPQDRAKDIESALDWCRERGVPPADDYGTPADFEKIPSIPVSKRSPEDRKQTVDDIFEWLRAGKPNDTDMADEFKKIDQMLPKKKGQSSYRQSQGD